MKRFISAAAVSVATLLSGNALAVVITNPIDYTSANVVGTADPGTASATVLQELAWANQILSLSAGTTTTIAGVDYRTHDTDEYTDVLTLLGTTKLDGGSNSVGAGFDYVLGKYNGKNAGYILFYLGGEASTIPLTSAAIWYSNPTAGEGYALSHWTAFKATSTSVPEPSTVALMTCALLILAIARRRRSADRRAR